MTDKKDTNQKERRMLSHGQIISAIVSRETDFGDYLQRTFEESRGAAALGIRPYVFAMRTMEKQRVDIATLTHERGELKAEVRKLREDLKKDGWTDEKLADPTMRRTYVDEVTKLNSELEAEVERLHDAWDCDGKTHGPWCREWKQIVAERDDLRAEVVRLRAERDKARELLKHNGCGNGTPPCAEMVNITAKLERAREALALISDTMHGDASALRSIARAALKKKEEVSDD